MKFQKNFYHIADSTGAPQKVPILVHFIGEQDIEKLFVPGPHGNAKNKEIAASYAVVGHVVGHAVNSIEKPLIVSDIDNQVLVKYDNLVSELIINYDQTNNFFKFFIFQINYYNVKNI